MRLMFIALLLSTSAAWASGLSTTKDGSFQAITQSPDTISLYWRQQSQPVQILRDGQSIGTFAPDQSASFNSHSVSGLKPGSVYSFSIENLGVVTEKTWSVLPQCQRFDLLIIGGTASGVSAAVTAARLGMNVALVEPTNRLGGMASNGLGSTDIRSQARANGFFEDFRRRVVAFYGEGSGLKYEPRVANAIFKSMVYEHPNVNLFLRTSVIQPIRVGNRVMGAKVRDCVTGRTGSLLAPVTIDATDTGDFAAASGAEFMVGREGRSECEPHAGVIYFDDKTQTILPGSTGAADLRQQSYAYLMIWRDYGDKGAPLISQPRFYNPESFRYSPNWKGTWNYTSGKLPNDKYEINQHPFGIDWPNINHDYPVAGEARRREIESMYRDRALGYLYFFQNERGYKNLGLADDEFLDNGNFPVSLYVREARRIVGEHVLIESDVTNARQFHRMDSILIGDYPMDSHATEELKDPKRIDKGEGEMWLVRATPWYQAPYGVIVPKRFNGLLVSTAVSGTHVGYGTLRMEPVRMSLGQAAAAAAYWSNLCGQELRDVNPAWIQDKLLSQYSYINWNSDVTRDTRHFKAINFLGARGVFQNEAFEPAAPLSRANALIVLNRMLVLECYPRGLDISPLPSPDAPVTRGQFAVWLVEAKRRSPDRWELVAPACPSYTDVPKDSPYYAPVETLRAHRINALLFSDAELGLFKPDAPINRADAAEAIFLAHRAYAMNYWRP